MHHPDRASKVRCRIDLREVVKLELDVRRDGNVERERRRPHERADHGEYESDDGKGVGGEEEGGDKGEEGERASDGV